jgi:acyl carrier protein
MTASMTQASLVGEVTEVIRKAARIPSRVPVDRHSRLVEDLAIDSLDLISVILQIQDHFDVVIEDDAVSNLCRVADLAAYLAERKDSACS